MRSEVRLHEAAEAMVAAAFESLAEPMGMEESGPMARVETNELIQTMMSALALSLNRRFGLKTIVWNPKKMS